MEGMNFQQVWQEVREREARTGNYPTGKEAMSQTAEEILEGFRYNDGPIDFEEAQASVKVFKGRVAGCTAMGYMFGSEALVIAIRWLDIQKPDHKQRVNGADRQTCCCRCHTCGRELKEVLDGELWCVFCERYN